MEAKQSSLKKFIMQQETQFFIPVYQRNYDWKIKQCEKLFYDIIDVANPKRVSHFIGSIVYIYDSIVLSNEMSKLTIIDGQQRITTMTLLWLAILERAKEFQIKKLERTILKHFIINEEYEGDKKLKLKPTANNDLILKGLINEGKNFEHIEPSNLIINFNFFYNSINEKNIDIVIEGISKLLFIEIQLERGKDDPQRIFESLNSTGLDLTQSDLIRNFILIDVEPALQNKLYTNYWRIIEKYANLHETNKDKIDDFMRDYLTMKNRKIPNKNKVYETFRENYQVKRNEENLEALLLELRQYAKHYNKLINPEREPDSEIRRNIEQINMLEVTVSYPFLLQVYQDYDVNVISKKEFIEVLHIVQSFVFRRFIVDLGTESLNKIFTSLYVEIDRESYINSLQLRLLQRQRSQRFPNNTEIKEKLKLKDLYNIKPKKRKYLFLQLENALHKEHIVWDDYTIEHIFPQKSNKWRSGFTEKEYFEMQNYLHTISNLTLTKYNSRFSNKIFSDKRDMPRGFKESHLFLNEYIANCKKWNLESINERYEILFNQFCEIWSYPDIEIPIDDRKKEINIFDVHDPTGLKIEYFLIDNEKPIRVNSNKELLVKTVKEFFVEEKNSFIDTELGKKLRIVKNPTNYRHYSLIDGQYYVYSSLSNTKIFRKTKLILETFNWSGELVVKFKENKT